MLQTKTAPAGSAAVAPAGHYRWVIIGLLFVITTINYMDRNLLGVLKPTIQGDLHFNETEYGQIVFAFSMAYAAGYASMGAFTDRVGVRIGLAVAAMIWCAASAAHGLVTGVDRIHLRPDRARPRRGRQLPDLHQVRRHVVSGAGPRPRHGDLQLRQQCRRIGGAADRGLRYFAVGMAGGVLRHRRWSASFGWRSGGRCIARPRSIPAFRRRNWRISTATRTCRPSRSHGPGCCGIRAPGRISSAPC